MILIIDDTVKQNFPDLKVLIKIIKEVKIEKVNSELEKFKVEVYEHVKSIYSLESLKNIPLFRMYRDFFWKVGVDPTKTRPAAEALIRRVLGGKLIPQINTLVDSYNLASIQSGVALAAFDLDRLRGNLLMRFARASEEFSGIGMESSIILQGGEIVISDADRLLAIYPYRDAGYSKITDNTKNIVLLVCGVPGVGDDIIDRAGRTVVEYVQKFCNGTIQLFA